MADNMLTQMSMNYRKHAIWVRDTYTNRGIDLCDGFQKDAIQNSIGASLTKKFKDWKCSIRIEETSKGRFLIVEDEGTCGLTGQNIPQSTIRSLVDNEQVIGPNERLARFSSLNNSSSDQQGAGLYGVGKTMYAIASKKFTYYFDSLTSEGKYVANVNKVGSINEVAYEGDTAKAYIEESTGLSPKTTTGTRVIILEPNDEIVEGINNGSMEEYIQESWWIILFRLSADSGVYLNGKKVRQIDNDSIPYVKKKVFENDSFRDGKIKRFGIFVAKDGANPFTGISYYRKGMKIGPVDIDVKIPEKLADNLWGFVEVDEKWETALATIEDNTHFGVAKNKKRTTTYQNLKLYVNEKLKEQLTEWGYLKKEKDAGEYLNEELAKLSKEVQVLFSNMSFPELGNGSKNADYVFRLVEVCFPEESTARVTDLDHITFGVKITNNTVAKTTFNLQLDIESKESGIKSWQKTEATVEGNEFSIVPFDFEINNNSAFDGEINDIVIKIKPVGVRGKVQHKSIRFAYNCDLETSIQECVKLFQHSCVFPMKGSERVNGGDYLSNVSYRIDNRQNDHLAFTLRLRLHSPEKDKICDFGDFVGEVAPYEETVVDVGELFFDKEIIEQYVDRGILELRAVLIANKANDRFRKGEKITMYKSRIYYNCDKNKGSEDAFETQTIIDPNDPRRSWCEIGSKRTITLNAGHPSYMALSGDPEEQHAYLKEHLLKQYVLIFWKERKYEAFGITSEEVDDRDPADLLDIVMTKIEETLFRSME